MYTWDEYNNNVYVFKYNIPANLNILKKRDA